MAPITDYEKFLNRKARREVSSGIKALIPLVMKSKDIINFVPGSPNVETSPFVGVKLQLRDGQEICIKDEEMRRWQLYPAPNGMPDYLSVCSDLIEYLHHPPCWNVNDSRKCRVVSAAGGCDGLFKVFDMLLDENDIILLEKVSYPSAIAAFKTLGLRSIAIDTDRNGMVPESLRKALSKWHPKDAQNPDSDIPRVLYIVPHASNPTGCTLPLERRREIYEIAQEYDILIIEDDPYGLLGYDGKPLPSLLSMDTDGRVIHVNSFAKTFNPGLRLGYVCGSEPLMEKYAFGLAVSTAFACTLSQTIVVNFFKKYGRDGFIAHANRLGQDYKQRKEIACKMADKYLKGLAEWTEPQGGFYLWLKLKGVQDTLEFMMEKGVPNKIVFVPGECFTMEDDCYRDHIRCVFSEATEEKLEEGFKRLRKILLEVNGTSND